MCALEVLHVVPLDDAGVALHRGNQAVELADQHGDYRIPLDRVYAALGGSLGLMGLEEKTAIQPFGVKGRGGGFHTSIPDYVMVVFRQPLSEMWGNHCVFLSAFSCVPYPNKFHWRLLHRLRTPPSTGTVFIISPPDFSEMPSSVCTLLRSEHNFPRRGMHRKHVPGRGCIETSPPPRPPP